MRSRASSGRATFWSLIYSSHSSSSWGARSSSRGDRPTTSSSTPHSGQLMISPLSTSYSSISTSPSHSGQTAIAPPAASRADDTSSSSSSARPGGRVVPVPPRVHEPGEGAALYVEEPHLLRLPQLQCVEGVEAEVEGVGRHEEAPVGRRGDRPVVGRSLGEGLAALAVGVHGVDAVALVLRPESEEAPRGEESGRPHPMEPARDPPGPPVGEAHSEEVLLPEEDDEGSVGAEDRQGLVEARSQGERL